MVFVQDEGEDGSGDGGWEGGGDGGKGYINKSNLP